MGSDVARVTRPGPWPWHCCALVPAWEAPPYFLRCAQLPNSGGAAARLPHTTPRCLSRQESTSPRLTTPPWYTFGGPGDPRAGCSFVNLVKCTVSYVGKV